MDLFSDLKMHPIFTWNLSPSLVAGCDFFALVGNSICNDETNNENCNYDAGDCCLINLNTDYCSECACHILETCVSGYHPLVGNGICNVETNITYCYDGGDCCPNPDMVGNGFCNDETNNEVCSYDGGDCCGNDINSEHCEDCTCRYQGFCVAGGVPEINGDGICNDETNNPECNYDNGDCCVNTNTDYCSDCNCLGGGVITSPGFPGNYENNLDLTWLIQVQTGQRIEIAFLNFDVESHSSCG